MDAIAQTLKNATDTASESIKSVQNARRQAFSNVLGLSKVENHVFIFGSRITKMKGEQ